MISETVVEDLLDPNFLSDFFFMKLPIPLITVLFYGRIFKFIS